MEDQIQVLVQAEQVEEEQELHYQQQLPQQEQLIQVVEVEELLVNHLIIL